MKLKMVGLAIIILALTTVSQAQHVSVRLNFPVGVRVGPPGPPPFRTAIWIGPEWQWRGNRYVYVQGYWARPVRYGAVWVPGHWKYSKRGYRWSPGHWR